MIIGTMIAGRSTADEAIVSGGEPLKQAHLGMEEDETPT